MEQSRLQSFLLEITTDILLKMRRELTFTGWYKDEAKSKGRENGHRKWGWYQFANSNDRHGRFRARLSKYNLTDCCCEVYAETAAAPSANRLWILAFLEQAFISAWYHLRTRNDLLYKAPKCIITNLLEQIARSGEVAASFEQNFGRYYCLPYQPKLEHLLLDGSIRSTVKDSWRHSHGGPDSVREVGYSCLCFSLTYFDTLRSEKCIQLSRRTRFLWRATYDLLVGWVFHTEWIKGSWCRICLEIKALWDTKYESSRHFYHLRATATWPAKWPAL